MTDIETEVAGPDPGHGCGGSDGNPQHLRYTETGVSALERLAGAQSTTSGHPNGSSMEMSPQVSADKEVKSGANAQPPPDLFTMSADAPDTSQCYWTSSDSMRHQ
nr:unnamed protein product [Spirometra erinaceieuropaei]